METVPSSGLRQKRWVYDGIAAVLFLLVFWLRTQASLDESEPIYARTPTTSQTPPVVPSTPSAETVPAAAPQVTRAVPVVEAEPATNTSPVPKPAASQPAPEPTTAIASQAALTNAAPPSLPPKESPLPDFRLNGIIYTVGRPSAILNGQTVYVGDQVSGATVLSIRQTDVTLQINGLRKTYTLR